MFMPSIPAGLKGTAIPRSRGFTVDSVAPCVDPFTGVERTPKTLQIRYLQRPRKRSFHTQLGM